MKKLISAALCGAMLAGALCTGVSAAQEQVFATAAFPGTTAEEPAFTTTEVTTLETGISGLTLSIGADAWEYKTDKSGGDRYSGYISGKANPKPANGTGTYYEFAFDENVPYGSLEVTYRLGANKSLYVLDNGENIYTSDKNDATTVSAYTVAVVGGHTYCVYADGSKLGLYGCAYKEINKTADFAEEIDGFSFDAIRGENLDENNIDSDLALIDNYESQFGACDVRWETSNENVISNGGAVNAQPTETKVTITGIFTVQEDDSLSASKSFELTVLADPDDALAVAAAAEALTLGDTSALKTNLTLPLTGKKGAAIEWSSSDEGVITSSGEITRAPGIDSHAVLTALISRGGEKTEKTFNITVLGYVPVTVNAFTYTDADGNIRYTPVDGGSVKSLCVNMAMSAPANSDVLAAAVYGADGRLRACREIKLADIPYDADSSVEINLPMDSTDILRAFALSAEALVPYGRVYEPDNSLDDSAVIYVVGDSTAAVYTNKSYPRMGWAQTLDKFFDGVEVKDLALSGRSSVSFKSETNYKTLCDNIKAGDYLIVQFGHNDSKTDDRYSDPNGDRFTEGSFKNSMAQYVRLARDKGATPVIATSISRRQLSDASLEAYVKAAKELAEELDVPCVDLYAKTNGYINEVGLDAARAMFNYVAPDDYRFINDAEFASSDYKTAGTTDNTHINKYGAELISQWAADAIKDMRLPIAQRINDYRAVYPLPEYKE